MQQKAPISPGGSEWNDKKAWEHYGQSKRAGVQFLDSDMAGWSFCKEDSMLVRQYKFRHSLARVLAAEGKDIFALPGAA